MKLVSYNIQYGIGRDKKFDLPRIAASLEGADIIALQEVTRNFPRNNGADLVAGLAELLPDYFHVFGAAMDVDFGLRDESGKPANRRLQFGNMVLSSWPIAASRNLLLPRTRRLNRGNLQRSALETLVIARPDRCASIRFISTMSISKSAPPRSAISRSASMPIRWRAAPSRARPNMGFPSYLARRNSF